MISPRDMSLRACALGFDARSYTALQLFFRGKCGDKAVLVGEDDADVSIVDMDSFNGAKIFAEQRERHPGRPLILLSLNPPAEIPSGVIYIKKPVQIQSMLTALEQTAARLRAKAEPKAPTGKIHRDVESPAKPSVDAAPKPADASPASARPASPAIGFASREDRDTSHAALSLDERGFGDYIGSLKDIDPSNPMEVTAAQYDPKRYFQGYLQSACKTALTKNCALRLNTGWKPVTIFPQSREIWVDADDQQLRSFCLVPVHSIAELGFSESDSGIMTISSASASAVKFKDEGRDHSKLQRMDALIWKVALWTSAGRVPDDIDLNRPVYLRNWPNFTRLLVFPHALRIAALLSEQPRSLLNIAETLNIRQQYVFAFFSAARALGLADQAVRQSESLIAPLPVESKKDAGLFKKILQRLLRR